MKPTMAKLITGYSRRDRAPVVIVDGEEIADIAALLARLPELLAPEGLCVLARMLSHLARGDAYQVIADVAGFEASYRARLASEADGPWQEGVLRLRDFGVPDFSAMRPPRMEGDTLVFHASRRGSCLPYRVEAPLDAEGPGSLRYVPLALTPFEAPRGQQSARATYEGEDFESSKPEPRSVL